MTSLLKEVNFKVSTTNCGGNTHRISKDVLSGFLLKNAKSPAKTQSRGCLTMGATRGYEYFTHTIHVEPILKASGRKKSIGYKLPFSIETRTFGF